MRTIKKNQKRLLVMSIALFIICAMALGYAALSSSFEISGTGTISTSWDILFTRIEEKSSRGVSSNQSEITDKLTATFDVDLDSPGSYIEYNVTIKNNGNTDAVIAKVTGIAEANSADPRGIQFGISGIRIGDDLLAGSETTFVVRAEILSSETTLPSGTKTLELKVEVRQREVDSSGLVTTLSECFETNETGETITGYLCGKNNTNGYSEILDVNIPSELNGHTITKIGASAFYVKGLNSIHMGNTIVEIASSAFSRNNLRELHIPDSVKSIGNDAFTYNVLSKIEFSNNVTIIGMTAFRDNQMPLEKAFIYNRNSDGTEDKTSLNSYAGANRDRVIIPDGVKRIGSYAFNSLGLQSVVLPNGVEHIETYAFHNNKLTSITLPSSTKYIGDRVFLDNNITELTIPSNMEFLGSSAFGKNKLTQVEFMGTVPETVRNSVFSENPGLEFHTIKVPAGTLPQYKRIQIISGNEVLLPSQIWFGSDDESLLDAFYE